MKRAGGPSAAGKAEKVASGGFKREEGYLYFLDGHGNCVKDASASPLQIGRIPLRAPACDPTADPLTGRC